MVTQPEDLTSDAVAEALLRGWGLDADDIAYAAVGSGSHHWNAVADDVKWFVAADDLDARVQHAGDTRTQARQRLASALSTAYALQQDGCSYVVAPTPTHAGSCSKTSTTGVGKTVLLNRFGDLASNEGMHVTFIEAPETGDFRMLLALRLRKILLSLNAAGPAKRAVARALGVLKSFTWQLPDGSSIAIGVDAEVGQADSGMLFEDLADLLVVVGEAAEADRTGVLLAIDEVQYLSADELGALITAIHRTTQLNLPVVLVGAGLPQLPGLAGDAKSYAERLFDFPSIGSLNRDDARSAILIPANEIGVDFDPDAVEMIAEESRGYPYFLQEWGSLVWNLAASNPIRRDDVVAARPAVMDQLDRDFFLVRLDRLTPKERQYLIAMPELGPGPHRSGDVAGQPGVRVESVAPNGQDSSQRE
ncbi:hypothetical protein BH24ACT5_BH24ACT5_14980 [soil metagenome]